MTDTTDTDRMIIIDLVAETDGWVNVQQIRDALPHLTRAQVAADLRRLIRDDVLQRRVRTVDGIPYGQTSDYLLAGAPIPVGG